MLDYTNPTYWHWLVLAFVFFGIEMLAPGVFFLWLGFAAVASLIVSVVFPQLDWAVQYQLFAFFSVLSVVIWWKFFQRESKPETDQPALNQRGLKYKGRTLILSEAIVNGYGKVRVDDTQWRVMGEDATVGSKVKVVDVEGSILHVEAI